MHRFNVPDMTCGHCAGRVEKAVKGVDPQAEISVDLASKEVSIRAQADGAKLSDAIRSAGYENSAVG